MTHKLIELALKSNPYKVELQIIDYRDEGISLDIFIWKDIYTLLDIGSLGIGTVNELKKQLVDTYNFLASQGVNCEYIQEIEVL